MQFLRFAAGPVLAFSLLSAPLAYGQQPTKKPTAKTATPVVAKPVKPAQAAQPAAPTTLPPGVKEVESWKPAEGETGIAYRKFLLPNGLTVLFHEDHTDPIVHVNVAYHTGSGREVAGRSGFAHFYEHMMFEGSEHVPAGEHFKTIEGAGGTLNGFTQQDRTVYYELMPSNYLETALWLESDRMGFLHNAVTQERFENQRATVKNERGQNYDNRAYGRSWEVVGQALYPVDHPYSWPTIGYESDLNAATLQDLRSFLLRWYGPNNAALTIAGDVEPMRAIHLAARYFGTIPTGPAVAPTTVAPVKLPQDRYVSYQDNAAELPLVRFTYVTVPRRHADEPAIDALTMILGSGANSVLYQRLVKTQLAVDANAYQSNSELGGTLTVEARPAAGHTLAELDAAIRAALVELGTRSVTESDLNRFRAQRESELAQRLTEVNSRGLLLAEWQTLTGSPKALADEAKAYQRVTAADISRVYGQYLKDQFAVVLSVVPRKQPNVQPARPDSFTPPTRPAAAPDPAAGLTYQKPAADFDRSKKPVVAATPAARVPAFWTTTLPNGLKVLGTTSTTAPTVQMLLTLEGGQQLVPANQAGLAALTADVLNESTVKYTTEAFDARQEELGANVGVAADREVMQVRASGLSRNLQPTLALMAERTLHPRFDTADFRRVRQRAITQLADRYASAGAIANQVFRRALYGALHPFGHPIEGYESTLRQFKLEEVRDFYQKQFTPRAATLVVVGNVTKDQFQAALGELKTWSGPALKMPTMPELPPIQTKPVVLLSNRARSPQTEMRIGTRSISYDATGTYYRAGLLNVPFAASFSSRLNHTLREEKGWTYGIRGAFAESRANGTYRIASSIRSNAAVDAVTTVMALLDTVNRQGLTAEEVTFMKQYVGQTETLRYASTRAKLDLLDRVARYNLPADFPKQQQAILQAITRQDLNQLAADYLNPNRMTIVLVGPSQSQYKKLMSAGYEAHEVTADGDPSSRDTMRMSLGNGMDEDAGENNTHKEQGVKRPSSDLPGTTPAKP